MVDSFPSTELFNPLRTDELAPLAELPSPPTTTAFTPAAVFAAPLSTSPAFAPVMLNRETTDTASSFLVKPFPLPLDFPNSETALKTPVAWQNITL